MVRASVLTCPLTLYEVRDIYDGMSKALDIIVPEGSNSVLWRPRHILDELILGFERLKFNTLERLQRSTWARQTATSTGALRMIRRMFRASPTKPLSFDVRAR